MDGWLDFLVSRPDIRGMEIIFQTAAGVFLGGIMLVSLFWSLTTVHRKETAGEELTNWHYLAGLLPLALLGVMVMAVY